MATPRRSKPRFLRSQDGSVHAYGPRPQMHGDKALAACMSWQLALAGNGLIDEADAIADPQACQNCLDRVLHQEQVERGSVDGQRTYTLGCSCGRLTGEADDYLSGLRMHTSHVEAERAQRLSQ